MATTRCRHEPRRAHRTTGAGDLGDLDRAPHVGDLDATPRPGGQDLEALDAVADVDDHLDPVPLHAPKLTVATAPGARRGVGGPPSILGRVTPRPRTEGRRACPEPPSGRRLRRARGPGGRRRSPVTPAAHVARRAPNSGRRGRCRRGSPCGARPGAEVVVSHHPQVEMLGCGVGQLDQVAVLGGADDEVGGHLHGPCSKNTSRRRSSRPRTPLKIVSSVPMTPDSCSIVTEATSSTS